jgi:hypothetical protein
VDEDRELITIVCSNCGNEAEQQVGWLKARAGRTDFICAICHAAAQYDAKDLEFIIGQKRAGISHKLRIN